MLRYGRQLIMVRNGGQSARARLAPVGMCTRNQRPMYDQIGVAPDRRGEMSIAPQSQSEMTDIIGAVGRLCLAAEHKFINEGCRRCRSCAPQDPVEQLRLWRLPF